ncbi:MAG: hypothetical protein ACPGEF_05010 [Endozoicomonas sp.]
MIDETADTLHQQITTYAVYSDETEFLRAAFAFSVPDQTLCNKPSDFTRLTTTLSNTDVINQTKIAIKKGIIDFQQEAGDDVDEDIRKALISGDVMDRIFNESFKNPIFSHWHHDGLITALKLKQLSELTTMNLNNLANCIAIQFMEQNNIPISDGTNEGLIIKDKKYILKVKDGVFKK